MLIIENQTVYRIDAEKAGHAMFTYTDLVDALTSRTDDLMSTRMHDADGDALITNEYHADIVIRRLRRSDPELRSNFHDLYQRMFDEVKEKLLTTGGDISSLAIDMKPEEVPHNIHGEPGLAYDMDNQHLIDCADCIAKADVCITYFEEVARVQKSINAGADVGPDDFDDLLDKMPDIAEGFPPMAIALHVNGGVIMIGPKDTTPEFDDDLPMPTHVASRILN